VADPGFLKGGFSYLNPTALLESRFDCSIRVFKLPGIKSISKGGFRGNLETPWIRHWCLTCLGYSTLILAKLVATIGDSKGGLGGPRRCHGSACWKLCSQKSWGKVVVQLGFVGFSIFMFLASILSHFKPQNCKNPTASMGCAPRPPKIYLILCYSTGWPPRISGLESLLVATLHLELFWLWFWLILLDYYIRTYN